MVIYHHHFFCFRNMAKSCKISNFHPISHATITMFWASQAPSPPGRASSNWRPTDSSAASAALPALKAEAINSWASSGR